MPITVAIVEDMEEIRDTLGHFINKDKDMKAIGSFPTAEEALAVLPVLKPDLVIMDISLPGMSGIECIRQTKPVCPSTQFMMFTVYENDEKVFEALKAGATGYMLKKHGSQKVIESLKELHSGGAPMSAEIARKVVSVFQEHIQLENELAPLLTSRENEVLRLLATGLLYKEISQHLNISHNTVKQHIHNVYEKLHVQNRTEALNKFFGRD